MPRQSIDSQFREFHTRNPHIFEEITKRAFALRAAGQSKIGISLIFESMRYDAAIKTLSRDFKLNNNFRSRYSRLLLDTFPTLRGVITTRTLQAA
jgi:hypothetical protein